MTTEDVKVIRQFKPFRLGYCRCGCNEYIGIINGHYLKKYKLNHHTKNKEGLKGSLNGNWKGGRTKKKEYWYLKIPDNIHADKEGYVAEHVYFFTQYNKCCMLKWGVVHHIDENPENNMIWNLQGMLQSRHISHHSKKDLSDRRCLICDSKYTSYKIRKGIKHYIWFIYKYGFICNKCYMKIYNKKLKRNKK